MLFLDYVHSFTDTKVLVTSAIYPLLTKKNKPFDITVSTLSTWFVLRRTLRSFRKNLTNVVSYVEAMSLNKIHERTGWVFFCITVFAVKFLTVQISQS